MFPDTGFFTPATFGAQPEPEPKPQPVPSRVKPEPAPFGAQPEPEPVPFGAQPKPFIVACFPTVTSFPDTGFFTRLGIPRRQRRSLLRRSQGQQQDPLLPGYDTPPTETHGPANVLPSRCNAQPRDAYRTSVCTSLCCTHSPTHPLTHSSTQPFTHPPTHPTTHSLARGSESYI